MGTWALDFDPGLTGAVDRLAYFDGAVYAFLPGGTGDGVWERTGAGVWARRFGLGVVTDKGIMWDDRLWVGADGRRIWVSEDGTTWTEDFDGGGGLVTDWTALNGNGNVLYAVTTVGGNARFYRRTRTLPWAEDTDMTYATAADSDDIMNWGAYVFWSIGNDFRRWTGSAWVDDPILGNGALYGARFTVHGDILYAIGTNASNQPEIWRRAGGGWVRDFTGPAAWSFRTISVGGDDILYIGMNDNVNSRVYARVGGRWIQQSAAAGVLFLSATADADGNLFAGTNSCEFYLYTVDFTVTSIGGGLYHDAMDCDADGNAIYICVYNAAGQPILVKPPLPLAPDVLGVAVFNPADGDAINVKCSNVGGQLAISGNFAAAGNEQAETSIDGGNTWTDVDRDVWGVDTAQPLLLDPDGVDEIMVALATAQDLWETFDEGGSPWVQQNAAIGYTPTAASKMVDGDELIIGGPVGNLDYSPNRGQTLNSIVGSFVGAVAALEVI